MLNDNIQMCIKLGVELIIPENPQIIGALGAAILAWTINNN